MKHIKKSKSISLRISLALAVLVFAGISVLTVLVYTPMQDKARTDAENSLGVIAGNARFLVMQTVDFPMIFLKNNLADIAQYAGSDIISREDFVELMKTKVEDFPYICNFWFIFDYDMFDNNAALYAGTDYGDDFDGRSFAGIIYGKGAEGYQNIAYIEYDIYNDQVYLEALEVGELYLKQPYTEVVSDQGDEKNVLTICTPLMSPDGRVTPYLLFYTSR